MQSEKTLPIYLPIHFFHLHWEDFRMGKQQAFDALDCHSGRDISGLL
jgi:hypothetical protein